MPPQAYQTSEYAVPRGGIFLAKLRSTFAGSSDGKMNVQSACALNTIYLHAKFNIFYSNGSLITVIRLTFQARAILLSYILHAQQETPKQKSDIFQTTVTIHNFRTLH
jgi:hypothetical protein